jgi:hypothetical protein
VPRFHLRRWTKRGRIRVLDKTVPKVFATRPRNVAGERFYYGHLLDESGVIEEWLAQHERNFARLYRRVERETDVASLTDSERFEICVLFALASSRTRRTRATTKETWESLMNRIAETMGVTDWTVRIGEDYAMGLHLEMLKDLPRYAAALSDLRLQVLVNGTELPFTTSDHPVALHNALPPRPHRGGRLGFASPGIQLHLPISPKLCLILYDSGTYGELASSALISDEKDVLFERVLQLLGCFRHVFSRPDDHSNVEFTLVNLLGPEDFK